LTQVVLQPPLLVGNVGNVPLSTAVELPKSHTTDSFFCYASWDISHRARPRCCGYQSVRNFVLLIMFWVVQPILRHGRQFFVVVVVVYEAKKRGRARVLRNLGPEYLVDVLVRSPLVDFGTRTFASIASSRFIAQSQSARKIKHRVIPSPAATPVPIW